MNKIQIKLIAMALALTLSVSVVVMSSYAWMVLSSNPAATGIQVVIGGGNTILIAPDIERTVGDETYHIPGRFSDKMNFGMYDEYDYLKEIGGLTPVSTSNGIDWFLAGNKVDSFLSHANLPKTVEQTDEENNTTTVANPAIREGSYIYLDFWVVAPAGDYTLRVSTGTGDSDGGSFVIDLLEPVISEEEGSFSASLTEAEGSAAAAVRIGFLANMATLTDGTMLCYTSSPYNDNRFTALRGSYLEPNMGSFYSELDNFTIYEPNADYHPGNSEMDGFYVQTKPLMLGENGEIIENTTEDYWNSLTVQLKSDWIIKEGQSESFIGQIFNTAFIEKQNEWKESTDSQIMAEFYMERLQGQFSQYVKKGKFVKESGSLESYVIENGGKISPQQISGLQQTGATEDVEIIKLERNIPQRIRMFIWLEGQDMDCAASANSARFAVNIELAGGTE